MKIMRHVVIAIGSASLASSLAAAPASDRISQESRWFVDDTGRVVTIRGGNVLLPGSDNGNDVHAASSDDDARWGPDTAKRMAEQGFNGVRLVVFLAGVMPKAGIIDTAYVDRIAKAVAAYKAAGIYTMIDFHQDQYSAVVGVRGMPEWAVFPDGNKRIEGMRFPMGYFKDPAVQKSFDNFWKNHPVPGTNKGVQDLYVDGLTAVARRFRDEPAVIGIDVMNEPATGSRCAQPDPVKANCPELERELLKPFYERASQAINRAAPRMIVFVEPFMLQGALGTPIATPIAAKAGTRALSFHNYGPVEAIRDQVNDGALAHVVKQGAAIINTEWGFNNDPAEITGQAADFDARHISWLAWTRGAFEALVDPTLPDKGNGNRVALLRAYARPYAERTAGTPLSMAFDGGKGVMTYRYATTRPGPGKTPKGETMIRIPAIHYPHGYTVSVAGGTVRSAKGETVLRIANAPGAREVAVTLSRVGDLPPLPATKAEPSRSEAALRALPPVPAGPLTRNSLLGHVVATSGGRALLDGQLPGMLTGLSHVHGWEKMTLKDLQSFASGTLTEAKLAELDAQLGKLAVKAGPVQIDGESRLTADSLTSDLLADPSARAILDREAPGLSSSSQQGLFPQTRLRALQPAMPEILTDEALRRIEQALATLPQ